MSREIIITALRRAGATFSEACKDSPADSEITKSDLFEAGLTGLPHCTERRQALLKALELPEHLSPNALLDVLSALYTKQEFFNLVERHCN